MLLSDLNFNASTASNNSLVLEAESMRSVINSKLSRSPMSPSSATSLKDGSLRMQGSMTRGLSRMSSRNTLRCPSRSPTRGHGSVAASKFTLSHGPIDSHTFRKIRANDPTLRSLNCSNLAFNGSVGDPRPMTGNRLGAGGSRALAGALCYNRHIEVLDLSDNELGDHGTESLCVAIGQQENCQITRLVLSDNKIGDSGAGAIAEMLFMNSSIHTLDLRRNRIGPRGAMVLAEALANNFFIKSMNVLDNPIGDDGAMSFTQAIMQRKTNAFQYRDATNRQTNALKGCADIYY